MAKFTRDNRIYENDYGRAVGWQRWGITLVNPFDEIEDKI
jgi:hypothetical protein